MKRRIKPFTLFLYIFIIAYLILGTKVFLIDTSLRERSRNNENGQTKSWTGIISLWDIPYIEMGTGSNTSWLNARIAEFERNNPGIFIDVRKMIPQRAEMYFAGNVDKEILPDIISISPYEDFVPLSLYEDLKEHFDEEDFHRFKSLALKNVFIDDKLKGVPIMMGTYALFVNKDILEEREIILEDNQINYRILDSIIESLTFVKKERNKDINYYGFSSYNTPYSKPIVSMIYNESGKIQDDYGYKYIYQWLRKENTVPEGIENMNSDVAMKLFLDEQKVGVFLGNTRTLYKARALQAQGKGFELGILNLPIEGKEGFFQDQIVSYGLIDKDDEEKKDYCIAFLKSLVSNEAQSDLRRIGMFPIVNDTGYIYDGDPEMYMLEEKIALYKYTPRDEYWLANSHNIMRIFDRD